MICTYKILDTESTLDWIIYLNYYHSNKHCDSIEIRVNNIHKAKWKVTRRQIEKGNGQLFFCIKDIACGWAFKRWMKEPIHRVCEKYGGCILPQCKYLVPKSIWNDKQKEILCNIRLQAKQARIDLGWRTD